MPAGARVEVVVGPLVFATFVLHVGVLLRRVLRFLELLQAPGAELIDALRHPFVRDDQRVVSLGVERAQLLAHQQLGLEGNLVPPRRGQL